MGRRAIMRCRKPLQAAVGREDRCVSCLKGGTVRWDSRTSVRDAASGQMCGYEGLLALYPSNSRKIV